MGEWKEANADARRHKRFWEVKSGCNRLPYIVLALAFLAFSAGAIPASAQLATVTVETKTLGSEIPRDFVGLSLEVSTKGQGLHAFQEQGQSARREEAGIYALGHPGSPNEGFFRFMRDLGPGVLRLGGNSQDNTCWDPQQAPKPSACQAVLRAGDLRLFSTTARESGWKLILGVNLKQDSGEWALKEITQGVAKDIEPRQILGLEIGNEPDLFRRGARPANYSPADHVKDFMGYFNAFRENPVAKRYAVVGPATCCSWRNARDLGTFIDGVGAKNLKLVTVHNYSATTCGGKTVTIAQLLSPEVMERFNQRALSLVTAAHARGLPIAMAETNSASCGGMPGVSNAFASTVWGLDYMFTLAQDGFRYVNFHSSYRPGGSSYNPINTFGQQESSGSWRYRNVAQPLYYAMYLFARNASGRHILSVTTKASANIHAFAVTSPGRRQVNVFVLNEDLSATGDVRVRLNGRKGLASLLLVRAPSLNSQASDIHYGGVQFDSGGHMPSPHTTEIHPDSHGVYTFSLPTASVALLTVGHP